MSLFPAHETQPTLSARRSAPFIRWPVATYEFYISLCVALTPLVVWAMLLLGWRWCLWLTACQTGSVGSYLILRRFTQRGRRLSFIHVFSGAILLALLTPVGLPFILGLLLGIAHMQCIFFWGGTGRERITSSLLLAVLCCAATNLGTVGNIKAQPQGVLANNRLFMGDNQDLSRNTYTRWVSSNRIEGHDTVQMRPLQEVVGNTYHNIGGAIATANLRQQLEVALVWQLPSPHLAILGAWPSWPGAMSVLGLLLAGIFLCYRAILRIQSTVIFLSALVIALLLLPIDFSQPLPSMFLRLGGFSALQPGEMATLLFYEIVGSDAWFAAIIVLALPGAEPLTASGRSRALILAAGISALLIRTGIGIPAATLSLLMLQPLHHMLDRYFGRPSWLAK